MALAARSKPVGEQNSSKYVVVHNHTEPVGEDNSFKLVGGKNSFKSVGGNNSPKPMAWHRSLLLVAGHNNSSLMGGLGFPLSPWAAPVEYGWTCPLFEYCRLKRCVREARYDRCLWLETSINDPLCPLIKLLPVRVDEVWYVVDSFRDLFRPAVPFVFHRIPKKGPRTDLSQILIENIHNVGTEIAFVSVSCRSWFLFLTELYFGGLVVIEMRR